ncbi:hypothetical protein Gotri_013384 [Gossypium trilobum]|uniref:DUF7745 domain-containing protein n=1 Tax=Gossypium trilobum TaxID=34281 RepID=A0A7J9DTC3_9ROSI|nr:hypothetical protein [Gossypium trilobum]
MENEFLDKMEDNAAVRVWSEKMQLEKGDSLTDGYTSELWNFTCISVTQNNLQELKEIWAQWDDEVKQLFYYNYSDLPYLFDIKVDEHLFRALAQFWNSAYNCFTFGKVDLVPIVEEYTVLLRCPRIQADKAYSRAVNAPTFLKKLMNITGMSEQWVAARIKQKRDNKCIPWRNLKDLILAHLNTKKKVDVFALSIYGLVVFPKALGYVDEAVTDLFDRLDKRVTPVPIILAETFKSLNAYRRAGPMITPEYIEWWGRKINDNIPGPSQGDGQPIEKHLRVVPSELEIIMQDFERTNSELEKKIEQMEEEKRNLRLDMDVQKLETEKLRKGKNKAEKDLDSLKTDYKKLSLSMRTTGLGKTLVQCCQEIQEEKIKADRWERKFQEAQTRNETLEKSLLESRNEKRELMARVAELERSLHQYRNRNSIREMKASLSKIEEMKRIIEELEMAL